MKKAKLYLTISILLELFVFALFCMHVWMHSIFLALLSGAAVIVSTVWNFRAVSDYLIAKQMSGMRAWIGENLSQLQNQSDKISEIVNRNMRGQSPKGPLN